MYADRLFPERENMYLISEEEGTVLYFRFLSTYKPLQIPCTRTCACPALLYRVHRAYPWQI